MRAPRAGCSRPSRPGRATCRPRSGAARPARGTRRRPRWTGSAGRNAIASSASEVAAADTSGQAGSGSARGTSPTTATPWPERSRSAQETRIAPATTIDIAGQPGVSTRRPAARTTGITPPKHDRGRVVARERVQLRAHHGQPQAEQEAGHHGLGDEVRRSRRGRAGRPRTRITPASRASAAESAA